MNKFSLFIIIVLLFSCSKNQRDSITDKNISDSISMYLNRYNNQNLSLNKRILNNDRAYYLIRKSENNKYNRNYLDKILYNYFDVREWNKYDEGSKLLLKMAKDSKDTLLIANSYRYRGNFYYNNHIIDSSFYFYLKAEKFYYDLKDNTNISIILLKKGIIQYNINDFYSSEISLRMGYSFFEKSNDFYRSYSSLNYLGLVSIELKEYDKGIDYFKKALEIVESKQLNSFEHERAICLNNIGLVYQKLNRYGLSLYYFNLAKNDINLKKDNPEFYSIVIDNLAYSKFKAKDNNGLPGLFYKSLKIRDSIGKPSDIIAINNHLSEYYFSNKDTLNAIVFGNKSLRIAKQSNVPVNIISALKQVSIVDKKNASKYTEEYIRLSDSLQTIESKNKDRFARIQLETNEIAKEKDNAIRDKWLISGISLAIIIIAILLFIIYFQRTKQKELQLLQSQQIANEATYQIMLQQQEKEEQARQKEKKRIALELHDNIMNQLASTRHNLYALTKASEGTTAEQAGYHINKIHEIENEIRSLSHDLSKDVFSDTNSFVKLVQELINSNQESYDCQFELEIESKINWDGVSSYVKMHLYRIIQEGVHNSNKYAKASLIRLSIIQDETNLCVVIEDNGQGFDTQKNNEGIGLKNMKERIAFLNGKFTISSNPNCGTKLFISIPVVPM